LRRTLRRKLELANYGSVRRRPTGLPAAKLNRLTDRSDSTI
jgi:hypothetical protein